jgi:hypothetical protein
MRRAWRVFLVAVFVGAMAPRPLLADGSWIDGPRTNWNQPGMAVPLAPPMDPAVDPRCLTSQRPPETTEDRILAGAGWTLYSSYRAGWGVVVIKALSGYDGMCRPLGFQEFVFVHGTLAGTISPERMDSRADGAGEVIGFFGPDVITASYRRYKPDDPLCCPSGSSVVMFSIDRTGIAPVLVPNPAETPPAT